jgi:hypothetical protein
MVKKEEKNNCFPCEFMPMELLKVVVTGLVTG